MIDMYRK